MKNLHWTTRAYDWFLTRLYIQAGVDPINAQGPHWETQPTNTPLDVLETHLEVLEPGDLPSTTSPTVDAQGARPAQKVEAGPQPGRKTEPYTVETTQHIGDQYVLVSTGGVVITRPTSEYLYLPERGAQLTLETLAGACGRVTGLDDGETWLFRYSDSELADQDRAAHDRAVAAQKPKEGNR